MTTNVWVIEEPNVVPQAIDETSTVQNAPLGKIVRARHATFGLGEFIYLAGIGSTVVGSFVSYNAVTFITALAPNTANLTNPFAVAMSANVLSSFGWYQISGVATIKKTAVLVQAGVPLNLSATPGSVMQTAASGKQIQNCVSANTASVASSVGTITATINRPAGQGRVT